MIRRQTTFYIASSRDGLDRSRALAQRLEHHGWTQTFAWWSHFEHACSDETCGISNRAELADRELVAAYSCDVFIGIARLGKGSHVELGVALAGDATGVYLVGVEPADSVFYGADGVVVVSDIEALLRKLGVP